MSEIPVEIAYHPQRNSTARIREGGIYLRISSLISRREQERHIDELLRSMKKQRERAEGQTKTKLSLLTALESGILSISTGLKYQIFEKKSEGKKISVSKIADRLIFLQPIVQKFSSEQAVEVLWKFLIKDQISVLKRRLDELSAGWIDERCSRVRLRMTMSRWGSCDKKSRVIMLSAKLLLVEEKLLDYVCIHELAHLKYSDHSDLFWDLVSQKMPDWKIQRKKLRRYE